MAVMLRFVQVFAISDREEFLELERQFASLEGTGALPQGERLLPLMGTLSTNTLIWQRRFGSIAEAENAMKAFNANTEHASLFARQSKLLRDTWTELYQVLDL